MMYSNVRKCVKNKHMFHYEKDLMTLHPCQRQRKCHGQSCPNSSSSSGWWDLKPHRPSLPVSLCLASHSSHFGIGYWQVIGCNWIHARFVVIIDKKNGQQLVDSTHFSGNQQDRVTWRRLCVEFPVWALAIDRGRAIILRTAATKHP